MCKSNAAVKEDQVLMWMNVIDIIRFSMVIFLVQSCRGKKKTMIDRRWKIMVSWKFCPVARKLLCQSYHHSNGRPCPV